MLCYIIKCNNSTYIYFNFIYQENEQENMQLRWKRAFCLARFVRSLQQAHCNQITYEKGGSQESRPKMTDNINQKAQHTTHFVLLGW